MAITKTIQATVKNRTDTAANWTSKNPVLAEGEIIVVQTSAGETRLKIGDGVKTFTQLPYTDEQIYNNVVTSVNGQTGDVTLPNDFVINATLADNDNCTIDKTFAQIQEAVQAGKTVLMRVDGGPTTITLPLVVKNSEISTEYDFSIGYFIEGRLNGFTIRVMESGPVLYTASTPTNNPDGTMPQVSMAAAPTQDMQIATKKYVDDKISDKELILSSSTAGSTKKFKLTIDDTGTLTASEITA